MDDLPPPPIPPYIDLRTFDDMPLNVVRLGNSDLVIELTDAEFKAAVLLWARSWHQVPAGSLPNEDRKLAHMAALGGDLRRWKRVKEGALHGWQLCSDGRLYHQVICEAASKSWEKKRAGKEGAEARWNQHKALKKKNSEYSIAVSPFMTTCAHDLPTVPNATAQADEMLRTERNRTEEKLSARGRSAGIATAEREDTEARVSAAKKDEDESAFDHWWECYPRHVSKGQARKAWSKALSLPGVTSGILIKGAERYAAERAEEDMKYTKFPATWLNGECWLDAPSFSPSRDAALSEEVMRLMAHTYFAVGTAQADTGAVGPPWKVKPTESRHWPFSRAQPGEPQCNVPRCIFDKVAQELDVPNWMGLALAKVPEALGGCHGKD